MTDTQHEIVAAMERQQQAQEQRCAELRAELNRARDEVRRANARADDAERELASLRQDAAEHVCEQQQAEFTATQRECERLRALLAEARGGTLGMGHGGDHRFGRTAPLAAPREPATSVAAMPLLAPAAPPVQATKPDRCAVDLLSPSGEPPSSPAGKLLAAAPVLPKAKPWDESDVARELRMYRGAVAWTHGRLDGLGIAQGRVGQGDSIERLKERMGLLPLPERPLNDAEHGYAPTPAAPEPTARDGLRSLGGREASQAHPSELEHARWAVTEAAAGRGNFHDSHFADYLAIVAAHRTTPAPEGRPASLPEGWSVDGVGAWQRWTGGLDRRAWIVGGRLHIGEANIPTDVARALLAAEARGGR